MAILQILRKRTLIWQYYIFKEIKKYKEGIKNWYEFVRSVLNY